MASSPSAPAWSAAPVPWLDRTQAASITPSTATAMNRALELTDPPIDDHRSRVTAGSLLACVGDEGAICSASSAASSCCSRAARARAAALDEPRSGSSES